MKPQFSFYFADEPQYAVIDPREHIAHLLRTYRRSPRYAVRRAGLHQYIVRRTRGPADYPAAIISAIKPGASHG